MGAKTGILFCWKVDEIVRIYMRGEGGGEGVKTRKSFTVCVCFFMVIVFVILIWFNREAW